MVLHDFKDLEDGDKVYTKDGFYPNPANKKVDGNRLKVLLSKKNKQKRAVIKLVK